MRRLLAIALVLPAPVVLRAQSGTENSASLDAWRVELSQRLDQDIARLSADRFTASAGSTGAALEVRLPAPQQPERSEKPVAGGAPRWFPSMAALLRAQGLPASLLGVAAVESGFDPFALSPQGARGLWQLMPATARRFGLVVESGRDERLDPMKSTLAASRYLKSLHAQFRDWPLALAAYNSGEQRVERSLERLGASDFWTLSRAGALPAETRRYVPAALAKVSAFADNKITVPPTESRPQIAFATLTPKARNFDNSK